MTDRSTQKGVRAERIIVVDDEKQICNVITIMLVAANYECREAGCPPRAPSPTVRVSTVEIRCGC
jgi:hypothetical protein